MMSFILTAPMLVLCLGGLAATLYFGQRAMRDYVGNSDSLSSHLVSLLYPALLKISAITAAMWSGSQIALLRDSMFSIATLGTLGVLAFAAHSIIKSKSDTKLSRGLISTNIVGIAFAISLTMIATAYIPEFQFGTWLIITTVVAFTLQYFIVAAQPSRKASYNKCLSLIKGHTLTGNTFFQLAIMAAAVALLAILGLLIGKFTESVLPTIHLGSAGFGLVFGAILFLPEILMAKKLIQLGKIQSSILVVLISILSTLLLVAPVVGSLCYLFNIENVTILSDMQVYFLITGLGAGYFVCQDQQPDHFEVALLSSIAFALMCVTILL